jgi:O-antigen/teichoic acid export membrane protein
MSMRPDNPYGADQVRQSLIHFIFGKGATAVVGFALLLLVVRALPASEYGIYIALLAVLEITQLASNLGLFAAAYRYVPELRSRNQGSALHDLLARLSVLRLLTLIAAVTVIGLLAKPIAELLNLQGYEHVFVLYGFIVVAEGYARYLDVLFDSLLLQRYSQIAILVRYGLRLIGIIFAIAATEGEVSLTDWIKIELIASFVGAMLSAVMLFKYSLNLKKNSPGLIRKSEGSRRYLVFAGPSYLAQLIGLVYGPETTKLILTKIAGVLQVGAFGFAASVSAMLQRYLPVFLLLGLVRPLFVSAHDGTDRNKRLSQLSNIVLKLNFFVLFPLIAFMLASGDQLASVLSGGKFPDAGSYLLIFMVLLVFQTWHAVLGLVTLALEDGVSGLHGTVLGLLGLLGGMVFLPEYGTYSLCVGLVLSEIIWCVYVLFSLYKKGLVIKNDWLGTAKIFIFSGIGLAISAVVHKISNNSQLVTIILDLTIISSVFIVLSYLIKPFSNEERNLINKILPRPVFVW